MVIGGFQKFSLSDFPERISAIVFTRGCGFRCPYCHNPELVDPSRYVPALSYETVLSFLESRRGLLQGVVVSGGEPTIHDDLPDFLAAIKGMGFVVKLDTNGSNPSILEQLIAQGLCDYIAMDLKAPLESYSRLVGVRVDSGAIRRSLDLVIGSGLPHEIRTTYVESLLSDEDMIEIGKAAKGCEKFYLQLYRATKSLDSALLSTPRPTEARVRRIRDLLKVSGAEVRVR
jgi:pyruvate formate lyase activating enzyme